jgi:hypothetical protein
VTTRLVRATCAPDFTPLVAACAPILTSLVTAHASFVATGHTNRLGLGI